MARIKFLTSMVGPDESWAPGREYEVSEDFAAAVADGVRAVRVDAPAPRAPRATRKTKTEKAVSARASVETAVGSE